MRLRALERGLAPCLFLSSLRPSPARAPAAGDVCPLAGRAPGCQVGSGDRGVWPFVGDVVRGAGGGRSSSAARR
jgi:hypothetical protein